MGANIFISFVLPVRGRINEVACALDTILSIDSDAIECVLSDNCDVPINLPDRFRDDSRLRVVRPPQVLHMTDNFEFASRHARGHWLTFLGADDGVITSRYDQFRVLLESAKSPSVTLSAVGFFWPGASNFPGGRVSWFESPSYEAATMNSRDALRRWRRSILRGSLDDGLDLPRAYIRGAIRSDLVASIRERSTGRLFQTQAPDVYLSAKILSTSETFEISKGVFGIQGATAESNGLQFVHSHPLWAKSPDRELDLSAPGTQVFGRGAPTSSLQLLYMDCLLSAAGRQSAFSPENHMTLRRFGIVTSDQTSRIPQPSSEYDQPGILLEMGPNVFGFKPPRLPSSSGILLPLARQRIRTVRMRLSSLVELIESKHYCRQVNGIVRDTKGVNVVYDCLELKERYQAPMWAGRWTGDGVEVQVTRGLGGLMRSVKSHLLCVAHASRSKPYRIRAVENRTKTRGRKRS